MAFEQASRRAVSLQGGAVDCDHFRLARRLGQNDEDAVEHTQAAPANKTIVQGLVRTIVLGRIVPAQAVTDHEDDPGQHPPVIHPRHAVRQRKEQLDPSHLPVRQPR